jgi:formylmethanofuran dehydrogenase subunit E
MKVPTHVTLPIESPWLAWLLAMPAKCCRCGEVKSGDELMGYPDGRAVCDACIHRKGSK